MRAKCVSPVEAFFDDDSLANSELFCLLAGTTTDATAAPSGSTASAPDAAAEKFECGWAQDNCLAWRKRIYAKGQRGPVEFSLAPKVDSSADPLSPITCSWADGFSYVVLYITQVRQFLRFFVSDMCYGKFSDTGV